MLSLSPPSKMSVVPRHVFYDKHQPCLDHHSAGDSCRERKHSMSTITTTSPSATPSPLKRLIIRHPLVAFFVLAFAGAWITILPLLLSRSGFGLLPLTLPVHDLIPGLPLFTTIGAFAGPTLAAFIVTAATSGKAGLRQLLRQIVQWRLGVGWYLLALLGYPLLYVGSGIITLGVASQPTLLAQWSLLFTIYLPYLVADLISTMGEEMGWVGYALPTCNSESPPCSQRSRLGCSGACGICLP